MKFLISRFNPESDSKPYMQEFEVEVTRGMMLRDALLDVKRQDESFNFRHSCGEGVCGSDGVNVNGVNKLTFPGASDQSRSGRGHDSVLPAVQGGQAVAGA